MGAVPLSADTLKDVAHRLPWAEIEPGPRLAPARRGPRPIDRAETESSAGRDGDHGRAGREPRGTGRDTGAPRRAVRQALVHRDRESGAVGPATRLFRVCVAPAVTPGAGCLARARDAFP